MKQAMPLEYAKTFLAASIKNSLVDHAFGDSEVTWTREGREVASAYFGRSSEVVIRETKQFCDTSFEDEEARALENLGKRGTYEQNDAGDPRKW